MVACFHHLIYVRCSFSGRPCKRLVACHSLQCFWLVACMVACSRFTSSTASAGGHASDWSLAIHFHIIGWSLAWSLVYSVTAAIHRAGDSWRSHFWKSQTALAIDQTSNWSFAIYFVLEKSVACSTKCSVCFNCTLSICVLSICF